MLESYAVLTLNVGHHNNINFTTSNLQGSICSLAVFHSFILKYYFCEHSHMPVLLPYRDTAVEVYSNIQSEIY
jgi:hypothetical protein